MSPRIVRIVMALAALIAAASLAACAGGKPRPIELHLADLVRFADQYSGHLVSTSGVVHFYPYPAHYWIEDAELHRVEVYPDSAVSSRVGERVRVVGRFHYSTDRGRYIKADKVSVIARQASAGPRTSRGSATLARHTQPKTTH